MPHRLTSDEEMHTKFLQWWDDFIEITAENREKALIDRRYYDGAQWTDDEIKQLEDRGQPVIVANHIGPKVNFVLGVESKSRVDPQAYPRTKMHDGDGDAATDALRYVADSKQVNYNRARGWAARHQMVEGVGGVVFGVEPDGGPTKDGRGPLLNPTLTELHWDRIWYDPHSRYPDFRDAQYTGVHVWRDVDDVRDDPTYTSRVDLEEFNAILEMTESNFGGVTSDGFDETSDTPRWYDTHRNRIHIFEVYFRRRDTKGRVQWWGAHFTRGGLLLKPFLVPFKNDEGNNWNPMKLVSGYIDDQGNRYGMVRWMISLQDEINKRRSKSLHLLSVRQVLYEEGSVDDIEEAAVELAKPDGKVRVNRGAIAQGTFQVQPTGDLAQGQQALLQDAKNEIDNVGPRGTFDERATSGTEFQARQDAGSMELQPLFGNLREFDRSIFHCFWWLIRQYWTEERWIRIRDEEDGYSYKFVAINERITKAERIKRLMGSGMPRVEAIADVLGDQAIRVVYPKLIEQSRKIIEAKTKDAVDRGAPPPQLPRPEDQAFSMLLDTDEAKKRYTNNDVAKLEMDLRIESVTDSDIIQQRQFESLIGMVHRIGVPLDKNMLEMIVQASSFKDKRKLLAKMREPPPQEQVQAQQQQQQLAMAEMAARVAKLEAETGLKDAQAQKALQQAKGVDFEAQKDQAQAVKLMVEAQQIEAGVSPAKRGVGNDSPLQ